jgi:hypothetical protein
LNYFTKTTAGALDMHANNGGDVDPDSISKETYSQFVYVLLSTLVAPRCAT